MKQEVPRLHGVPPKLLKLAAIQEIILPILNQALDN